MKTEDIKNYTAQYIQFEENHNYGDPYPEYVRSLENDMSASDEFAKAFTNNPNGMKRVHKSKLSDKSVLRIFSHSDSEDFMAVVEHLDGKLSWSCDNNVEVIKAMHHARLPYEYVFSIIKEPNYDMQIAIMPKFIADSDFRDVPTIYDTSIAELEPMWNATWFRSLFDNYLSTHSEGIFTSNDENRSVANMKQILENSGLIYDLDLEECSLEDCDLQPQNGASYQSIKSKI